MRHTARSRALLALALLGLACGGTTGSGPAQPKGLVRKPGAPVVLVLMPNNPHTQTVLQVLGEELSSDFDLVPAWITAETSSDVLAQVLAHQRPSCIILMDTAVGLYSRYQRGLPVGTKQPPAVVLMTPLAEEVSKTIVNASSIAYEIPSVVQFVTLRSLLDRPVARVGVVYRAPFASFIRKQQALAQPERVEIVPVELPSKPTSEQVAAAVARLYEPGVADCLWVLNDSVLLTSELISNVWLPSTSRGRRMPVIVGVSSLLTRELKLGSFAMLPDHASLGAQAASLVFDLAENGWAPIEGHQVQYPLSVRTVVDVGTAQKYFGFRKASLSTIDEVLE